MTSPRDKLLDLIDPGDRGADGIDLGDVIQVIPTGASMGQTLAALLSYWVFATVFPTATAAENTAAIVAAMARSNHVELPAGTFLVNGGTIEFQRPGLHLRGAGENATILKLANSPTVEQGPVIRIAHYQLSAVRGKVEHCSLSSLEIDGNKANQPNGTDANTSGSGVALQIEDALDVTIRDVRLHDCDGYGSGTVGSHLPHRGDIRFENVWSYNNNYDGFDIKANLQSARFNNCKSFDNGSADSSIEDRDAVGFDVRGDDVQLVGCVASNNVSGNFRIRENSGRMNRLIGCISRDAPTGVYGFHLIGGGIGCYTLISCHSFNDSTGFRWRAGHHKLIGCTSNGALNYGVHIDDDGAAVITTTTATLSKTTAVIATIAVVSATNIAPGMYVRVNDGIGFIDGTVLAIANNVLTLNVQSNFGAGGTLNSNASVSQLIRGSFVAIGCHFTRSGIDNITIIPTALPVKFVDCDAQFAARYGMNCQQTDITLVRCDFRNNARGINFGVMASQRVEISDCVFTDDQTDKTQTYAFQWGTSGNQGCTGFIRGSKLVGNATGVNSGTVPTGIEFRSNAGMPHVDRGTTAARPVGLNAESDVGFPYFDTTIGLPVYWTGAAWNSAAGVAA